MAERRGSPLILMLTFFLLLMILFNPTLRDSLADGVGVVFFPLLGFNYHYPVISVFMAGSIVIIISTVLRHFSIDWMEMAKMQELMSKFQREYREARTSKNTYKIKKLEKMQPQLMQKQSRVAGGQMKLMPITMLIFIPIFTWIWTFLSSVPHHYFTVPWSDTTNFFDRHVLFFNWILLYMLLSIPLTQVMQYLLKIISWSKTPQKK
jgi:uncharacterized membrane protein (DUF106 family)